MKLKFFKDIAASLLVLLSAGCISEREIQQVVDVDDIRLHRLDGVRYLLGDEGRPVRVRERPAHPVVDHFDDGEAVLHAPRHLPMLA